MDRKNFYKSILKKTIKDKDSKILVTAGGSLDKRVFSELGYKNVTISNLDSRMDANQYLPYKWIPLSYYYDKDFYLPYNQHQFPKKKYLICMN